MRKPSSRWILSTVALVGVAASAVVACGDDDTGGSSTSSSSGGADGGGSSSSGSASSSGTGSTSSSGGTTTSSSGVTVTDGSVDDADTGASSSGDSGNPQDSGTADADAAASPDGDASTTADADASKPDANDASTCSTGGSGTCQIESGTYTLRFTSGVGTPACPLPPDRDQTIDTCQANNQDAGPTCQITYDFVNCKQTLRCVETQSAGGFTVTTTVDNLTTWTSTQITGTSHSVTTGLPINSDCTYQYTLTKKP